MLNRLPGEEFVQLQIEKKMTYKYAVSNFGRLISYLVSFEDGRQIKPAKIGGYPAFTIRWKDQNKTLHYKTIYLYRAIAEAFVTKSNANFNHVIHIDYHKENDHYQNLKWVSREEMLAHAAKSPMNITRKDRMSGPSMSKLSSKQVLELKRILSNPNKTITVKQLAKDFGVSEMQIYRIKSGENWGHITI
jgi:hypothetical protein